MKIYTKTGDTGQTGLIGGKRVWKHALRIETYGTVDELNSLLGVAHGFLQDQNTPGPVKIKLAPILSRVQNELFDLGCQLASPQSNLPREQNNSLPAITLEEISNLERLIDNLDKDLEGLKQFILPGGCSLSGILHLARSVCRRAERRCVQLSQEDTVDPALIVYLNRLSDMLFVLARWVQKGFNLPEIPWRPKKH